MFFILIPGTRPDRFSYFFNTKVIKKPIIQILFSINFPKTQKINSRKKIRETGPGAAPIIINALSFDSFPTHVGINFLFQLHRTRGIHQKTIVIVCVNS